MWTMSGIYFSQLNSKSGYRIYAMQCTLAWIYENTIEPHTSHTSAHTFLDDIFQNSNSHVFMNVEILGKRESTCHQMHAGTWGNSHFQAQVRGSNMNTSLIMSVRKPARKQESHCTKRQKGEILVRFSIS